MRMRIGIKAKQVVGVTSIVGTVVVILSLFHLATLAHVQARGEQGQGRAAGQRRAAARQTGGRRRRRSERGVARRSRAPVDPRIGVPDEESHVCRDRRSPRYRRGARRSLARRAAPAAGRRPGDRTVAVAAGAAQDHLHRPGAQPRVPAEAVPGQRRGRVDSRRRLDAAGPRRPRDVAVAGASSPRWARSASPCSWRRFWRSCCCGRFT